jgi:predicted nucleic acid-binding protein
MKRIKIYLDTSIINFLFADDVPEYKSVTEDFFQNYYDIYDVFISETVLIEIGRTKNETKRKMLLDAVKQYRLKVFAPLNDEIENIADAYVTAGVIPKNKFDDALHIAFCVYYDFDILLSWNFKHLANFKKQVHINAINKTLGYFKDLNLFNPMEVMYEDEF